MANFPRVNHTPKIVAVKTTAGTRKFKVYPIGELAQRLHRQSRTISMWERTGVIPPPILSRLNGKRYYLAEEIDLYVRVAEQENIKNGLSWEKTNFKTVLKTELYALKKRLLGE